MIHQYFPCKDTKNKIGRTRTFSAFSAFRPLWLPGGLFWFCTPTKNISNSNPSLLSNSSPAWIRKNGAISRGQKFGLIWVIFKMPKTWVNLGHFQIAKISTFLFFPLPCIDFWGTYTSRLLEKAFKFLSRLEIYCLEDPQKSVRVDLAGQGRAKACPSQS